MSRAMIWALAGMVIAALAAVTILSINNRESSGVLMVVPTIVSIYAASRSDEAVKQISIVKQQNNRQERKVTDHLLRAKTLAEPAEIIHDTNREGTDSESR